MRGNRKVGWGWYLPGRRWASFPDMEYPVRAPLVAKNTELSNTVFSLRLCNWIFYFAFDSNMPRAELTLLQDLSKIGVNEIIGRWTTHDNTLPWKDKHLLNENTPNMHSGILKPRAKPPSYSATLLISFQ